MKLSKKVLIFAFIFLLIIGVGGTYFLFRDKEPEKVDIHKVINSKYYAYLPDEAKDYIVERYEKTGDVLLTEKNKKKNVEYLNPKFIEYLTLSDKLKKKTNVIPVSTIVDYVPIDTKISKAIPNVYNTDSSLNSSSVDGSSYVTKIKNQGSLGICWAMSTTSVAESYLLATTNTPYEEGISQIFSPRRMDYLGSSNGIIDYTNEFNFDRTTGDGGNFEMASLLMGSALSLADESWETSSTINKGYTSSSADKVPLPYYLVDDFTSSLYESNSTIIMPNIDGEENSDVISQWRNTVKQNIINYGSAYVGTVSPQNTPTGMITEDSYSLCSATYNGHVVLSDDTKCATADQGHAMQIIGWDDNFEYKYCVSGTDSTKHSNFNGTSCADDETLVTGKGVWILKNSWGDATTAGEYVYPYLAYDSKALSVGFVSNLTSTSEKEWDNIYNIDTAAVKRNSKYSETVQAVKFVASTTNPYTILIYDGDTPYMTQYTPDHTGLVTVDLSDEEFVLHNKELDIYVYYLSEGTPYYGYYYNIEVLTKNNFDEKKMDIPNTYINHELGVQYINLDTRNVPSKAEINYTLYSLDGETQISEDDYEISENYVGNNKVHLKLNLKDNLANDGYTLKASYSGINTSGQLLFREGEGTKESPYVINTVSQLHEINEDLSKHYILGSDIDLTDATKEGGDYYNDGLGWIPIGKADEAYFEGSLDGNGHKIIGLNSNDINASLFYSLDGATINNLTLDKFILSNNTSENENTSGVAALAYMSYNANISNVTVSNSNISSLTGAAGLIGDLQPYATKTTISNVSIGNSKISGTTAGAVSSNTLLLGDVDVSDIFVTNGEIKAINGGSAGLIFGFMRTYGDNEFNINRVFNSASVVGNGTYSYQYTGLVGGTIYIGSDTAPTINVSNIQSIRGINYASGVYANSLIGFIRTITSEGNFKVNFENVIMLNHNSKDSGIVFGVISRVGNTGTITFNNILSNDYSTNSYYNTDNSSYTANAKKVTVKELVAGHDELSTWDVTDWDDFVDNWVVSEKDDITRIPVIKNAPFEYTTVSDITVTEGRTVNIYDYLSPDIDLAKNITYEIDDTNKAEIDSDGNIIGKEEGETTINIVSNYDGYVNDVNITVTGAPKITFDKNNENATGEMNDQIIPANPTDGVYKLSKNGYELVGYTFKGWTTNQDGTGTLYEDEDDVSFEESQTLYALWEANEYEVSFDANGGEVNPESKDVVYDDVYGELPVPTRDGYEFAGWYTLEEGGTVVISDTIVSIVEDQTLYAHWNANTYEVSFDANGGEVTPESKDVVYDDAYGGLPVPTKTGYTFEGWYTAKTGGSLVTSETKVKIIDVQTLYAHWSANTYEVSFDANGGEVQTDSKDVVYDDAYGELPTPTRTGYTFDGWYTAKEEGTKITSETKVTITENQTLYALWTANEYEVEFDANSGEVETESKVVVYDKTYGALPVPTKTGYTFDGWYTAKEEGTKITSDTKVAITKKQTLYALWTANTYTIKFDKNDDDATGEMDDLDMTYNIASKLTKNSYEKTGYTFEGWSTSDDGEVVYEDEEEVKDLTVISDDTVTLYAVWSANIYTITFDGNGVSNPQNIKGIYNSDVILPTVTKTGYTFEGWYKGNNKYTSDKMPAENVSLVAHWSANAYTIKFDKNDDDVTGEMEDLDMTYDTASKLTKNSYEKTGYSFYGWSTSDDGEVVYEDEEEVKNLTVVKDDTVTLYAVWGALQYTISFDSNGGSVVQSIKGVYDSDVNLPIPTKTGYTFEGWYKGDNKYTSDKMPAENVSLVAHWSANTYEIKFDKNGDSATGEMDNLAMTYDALKKLTTNTYENVGYTFEGWSTSDDGEVVYEDGVELKNLTSVKGAIVTLYAVWSANTYEVSFDANGGEVTTESKTVTYDKTYGTLPIPTKDGYTFDGWYTAKKEGTKIISETKVKITNNITLYAVWTANTYKIEFNKNDDKATKTMEDLSMTYDVEKNLSENAFLKTGYTFKGWATETDGEVVYTDKQPVKNLTKTNNATVKLYAVWEAVEYKITFDSNGGSSVSDIKGIYDSDITLPVPTREGYIFDGWYKGDDKYTAVKMPADNISLKAKWEAITYTIDFSANTPDATGDMDVQVMTYDVEKALLQNKYQLEHYTFKGWATTSDGDVVYTDKQVVKNLVKVKNSGIILYAVWEANEYEITFDSNGGSIVQNIKAAYKSDITLPTVAREGYTFDGWYKGDNKYTAVKMPGENTSLIAHWTANTYEIKFDKNADGATGEMDNLSMTYDVEKALTANIFEYDNYKFTGWNTNADGTGTIYTDKQPVKNLISTKGATITLYAMWEEYFGFVVDTYSYDKPDKFIGGVKAGTDLDEYESHITLDTNYTSETDYKTVGDKKLLYTGSKTRIYKSGELLVEFTNIVKGDLNGDGSVGLGDLSKLYNYYRRTITIDNASKEAGDVNNDNSIGLGDLSKLYNYYKKNIDEL